MDHWSPLDRAVPTLQADHTFLSKLFPGISLKITTESSGSVRSAPERGSYLWHVPLEELSGAGSSPSARRAMLKARQGAAHCSHTGRTHPGNATSAGEPHPPPPGLQPGAGTARGEPKHSPRHGRQPQDPLRALGSKLFHLKKKIMKNQVCCSFFL